MAAKPEDTTNGLKRKSITKMNGTMTRIIQVVAGAILVTLLLGLGQHFLDRNIHQTPRQKENQTYRWFSDWWDKKFEKDIQPEFEELKQMIRDQCSPMNDKKD